MVFLFICWRKTIGRENNWAGYWRRALAITVGLYRLLWQLFYLPGPQQYNLFKTKDKAGQKKTLKSFTYNKLLIFVRFHIVRLNWRQVDWSFVQSIYVYLDYNISAAHPPQNGILSLFLWWVSGVIASHLWGVSHVHCGRLTISLQYSTRCYIW